jgi:hypothetical protein
LHICFIKKRDKNYSAASAVVSAGTSSAATSSATVSSTSGS